MGHLRHNEVYSSLHTSSSNASSSDRDGNGGGRDRHQGGDMYAMGNYQFEHDLMSQRTSSALEGRGSAHLTDQGSSTIFPFFPSSSHQEGSPASVRHGLIPLADLFGPRNLLGMTPTRAAPQVFANPPPSPFAAMHSFGRSYSPNSDHNHHHHHNNASPTNHYINHGHPLPTLRQGGGLGPSPLASGEVPVLNTYTVETNNAGGGAGGFTGAMRLSTKKRGTIAVLESSSPRTPTQADGASPAMMAMYSKLAGSPLIASVSSGQLSSLHSPDSGVLEPVSEDLAGLSGFPARHTPLRLGRVISGAGAVGFPGGDKDRNGNNLGSPVGTFLTPWVEGEGSVGVGSAYGPDSSGGYTVGEADGSSLDTPRRTVAAGGSFVTRQGGREVMSTYKSSSMIQLHPSQSAGSELSSLSALALAAEGRRGSAPPVPAGHGQARGGAAGAGALAPTGSTLSADLELQDNQIQLYSDGFLGSGAFGSVYKGVFAGQDVAVKMISQHLMEGPMAHKDVHAFQQELGILARLNHPNIVQLFGGCMKPPRVRG